MAFDLIGNFRKYQRFWMAAVLFLCMITFVLCTGVGQSGLQDRAMALWYQLRGGSGKSVATIDGRSIGARELDELKKNREVANEFMRAALKVTANNVDLLLKDKQAQLKKGEIKAAELAEAKAHAQELAGVLKQLEAELVAKPRFFDTGTKLDDLLQFLLWRDQATRLNVDLVEKTVKELVELEVSLPIMVMNKRLGDKKLSTIHQMNFWNAKSAIEAMYKVRENHQEVDYEVILNALKDEFRVQIVQFGLLGNRVDTSRYAVDFNKLGYTVRFPLTPHQLWTAFKEDVTKFDVVMLPVKVDSFLASVGEPTKAQLEDLFSKYKGSKFNPASDRPGFIQPEKVKIQYITANPESKYYMNLARLVTSLEMTPPGFVDIGNLALGTAVREAVGKPALDAALDKYYQQDQKRFLKGQIADFPYEQSPLTEPNFELSLYSAGPPSPKSVAALVGSMAAPAGQLASGTFAFPGSAPGLFTDTLASYQAAAVAKYKDKLQSAVKEEIERRVPVGMTLLLSGLSPTPLSAVGMSGAYLDMKEDYSFFPFPVVAEKYLEKRERFLAGKFAERVMEDVQTYLEKHKGKPKEFIARLKILKEKYGPGIEIGKTKGFVTQYDVGDMAKEPGLAKLHKAYLDPRTIGMFNYIEGRAGTDTKLTEDDFYKLFFDSSESFSVAASSPYIFQPWPPVAITKNAVSLGQIGQPGDLEKNAKFALWNTTDERFLFWKTDVQEAKYPEKLAEVEDKVRDAWKFLEARKKAFDEAKRVAEELGKHQAFGPEGEHNYVPELEKAGAKFKTKPLILDQQSKKERLPEVNFQGMISGFRYENSKLPKGLIPYPREGMSKEVFSLFDLKKPISYWEGEKKTEDQPVGNDEQVDKLNKDLFQKDQVRQIQILANKPRSIYYVAALNKEYGPPKDLADIAKSDFWKDFMATYAKSKGMGQQSDYFIQMARSEKALQFRTDMIDALMRKHLKIVDRTGYD